MFFRSFVVENLTEQETSPIDDNEFDDFKWLSSLIMSLSWQGD